MNLSKPMRVSRKAEMRSGKGEAWFYICPKGIEIEVADEKGYTSRHSVFISADQLARAWQVIRDSARKGK